MKKTWKIAVGVVAVAGISGSVWAMGSGNLPFGQKQPAVGNSAPVAVTIGGKAVSLTTPVDVTKGKAVSLGLANHSLGDVQLTITGLQDTPLPVKAGAATKLDFVPTTPGTYPIMEQGTMPNTRSVEGGTSGFDMEVGKVEVSPN